MVKLDWPCTQFLFFSKGLGNVTKCEKTDVLTRDAKLNVSRVPEKTSVCSLWIGMEPSIPMSYSYSHFSMSSFSWVKFVQFVTEVSTTFSLTWSIERIPLLTDLSIRTSGKLKLRLNLQWMALFRFTILLFLDNYEGAYRCLRMSFLTEIGSSLLTRPVFLKG